MISFASDYLEGAHPAILQALVDTNLVQQSGYSEDRYCSSAREKIRQAIGCPMADVFFLTGGTQTNAIVIASILRPVEGVVCVSTGHIAVHEAGAVEATGHKVLTLPHHQGRMDAGELDAYLCEMENNPTRDHMVFPGLVYLSHPTEYGTIYTRSEMHSLHDVCQKHHIPLFVDGARLGYAITSPQSDLSLREIAQCCDVFYIGGTKVGALCGEAVVFPRGDAPAHFMTFVKQRGAMVAKGRLLGVQFDTLFTGGLYESLGRHANEMAEKLVRILALHGIPLLFPSPTNQQFAILERDRIAFLQTLVTFEFWEKYDETRDVIRFVTSWATQDTSLAVLEESLTRMEAECPH